MRDNRFVIRSDKPHVEVSWRVEAVRNDPWVARYGAPVEQEKPAERRGKYVHPELYGMPKELGVYYRADHERMGRVAAQRIEALRAARLDEQLLRRQEE